MRTREPEVEHDEQVQHDEDSSEDPSGTGGTEGAGEARSTDGPDRIEPTQDGRPTA